MTQTSAKKSRVSAPVEHPPTPDWRASVRHNQSRLVAGTTGAALTGAAVFNAIGSRRAEAANPPAGRFVDVDGVRLHYVDRGEVPPVVLLHGNGVMLQDFEVPAAMSLSGRYPELDLLVIMTGAGDRIVHVHRHAERLMADVAGAELRTVPGQGHMLHHAVPEQVAAATDDVQERIG